MEDKSAAKTTKPKTPPKRAARYPKKLRGDAARAAKLGGIATETAKALERSESHRRTLIRALAAIVERQGCEIRIPFREVAAAPDLGMMVENEGTRDAVMVFATPPRSSETKAKAEGILLGDGVFVTSWAADPEAELADRVGLRWKGVVSAIDQGELYVVQLESTCPFERVVVRRAWLELAETAVDRAIFERDLLAADVVREGEATDGEPGFSELEPLGVTEGDEHVDDELDREENL